MKEKMRLLGHEKYPFTRSLGMERGDNEVLLVRYLDTTVTDDIDKKSPSMERNRARMF